jgi:hypothetical protein
MAQADKAEQRTTMILQLGRLLAPIYDLAEKPTPPTSTEYQVVGARFKQDLDRWRREARNFVIVGGVTFVHEFDHITKSPNKLFECFRQLVSTAVFHPDEAQHTLIKRLKACEKVILAAINRVPIEWEKRLFAEKTPFSTYLGIRDAISTAQRRIHYIDRYIEASFYSLYLRDIQRSLEIRIVTTKGDKNYGVENIIAVSKLAAQEFSNYQLIECQPGDMHERNLRIDDTIFFLGASINQAGKYPTSFAPSDSTTNGHQILNAIFSKGKVIT